MRSSVKRAGSGFDVESWGAVIVMEGVEGVEGLILRLLISSVETPFEDPMISGISAVV